MCFHFTENLRTNEMHGIRNIMAGRLTQFRSGKNGGKHWQYFVCVLTFISASSIFILPRFPSPKLSSLRIFSATSDLACLKISISCFLISSSPTFPFFHLPILHIPIFPHFHFSHLPIFPPSHSPPPHFPTFPFSKLFIIISSLASFPDFQWNYIRCEEKSISVLEEYRSHPEGTPLLW